MIIWRDAQSGSGRGIVRVFDEDGHGGGGYLVWLHFSPVELDVGDRVVPPGRVSPKRADLAARRQYRADRVYMVRALDCKHVPLTDWSGPDRWCYEVDPEGPIEADSDPTHRHFDSWLCPSALIVAVARPPSA